MGEALAPLRSEGVLIVGSGFLTHNLHGTLNLEQAKAFSNWASDLLKLPYDEAKAQLIAWKKAPHAKAAHPREEHLLPLHVAFGASYQGIGSAVPNSAIVMHDITKNDRLGGYGFGIYKWD
jgi:aromatic ring-opening dioxygenase catalytic subunit (LigB family)